MLSFHGNVLLENNKRLLCRQILQGVIQFISLIECIKDVVFYVLSYVFWNCPQNAKITMYATACLMRWSYHTAVQNCSSLDQQSHGLFCSQVKSHPHSYGKQNHYAQQYNISRTTRSGLFAWSSVDRWSWFVPPTAEKICKKNVNTASEDYCYLHMVPHTFCVFGRSHFMNVIMCTLRSLQWNPCAIASSLWFSLILTHFPSFFSTCCICKHHFTTFLLLFIVTAFSIFASAAIILCTASPSIFPLFFSTTVETKLGGQTLLPVCPNFFHAVIFYLCGTTK